MRDKVGYFLAGEIGGEPYAIRQKSPEPMFTIKQPLLKVAVSFCIHSLQILETE
jgi:hypothetical protein